MKRALSILGGILVVLGLSQGKKAYYKQVLTEYDKGYIWGSAILVVVGILLLILSFKRAKTR